MTSAKHMLFAIRSRLGAVGENSPHQLNDVDILLSVNLAKDFVYDELLTRAPDRFLTSDATQTTIKDVAIYTWSSSWKRVESLQLPFSSTDTTPQRYQGLDAAEVLRMGNTSTGRFFYRSPSGLVIGPTPAETGLAITVYYYPELADLTAEADTLALPQGMIDLVMLRACMDIAGMNGWGAAAVTCEKLYNQHLISALKGQYASKNLQSVKYSPIALRI
jgi:hypothetical protein